MDPYRVGILGATGLVGQRLIERLQDHPWFRITALAASERSAGRTFGETARWRLSERAPAAVQELPVRRCRLDEMQDCDLVLSALDSDVAREVEPRFARDGFGVISNSSALRMADDVPLLVPEVNPEHLALLEAQRARTAGGFVVTNPNCSTTGLVIVLAALHRAFGVRRAVVGTLQAISGAGAEGPRALDLLDNVLPLIPGEEEKIECEVGKILGDIDSGKLRHAAMTISAHCHRVPTLDGHLEAVSLELDRQATPEAAAAVLREYRGAEQAATLPSAPARPIVVRDEPDRPQPRMDRDAGGGMSVVVGRVRPCAVLGLKLVLLSHNTVRGAAGGTLLNAELLAARGVLPRRTSA